METKIHPKLKSELLAMKYLKIFFPVIGIIIFCVISFIFIQQINSHNQPISESLLMLGAGFLGAALFIGLSFALRKQETTLQTANRILVNSKPEKKILNATNIISFKGGVYYLTDTIGENPKDAKFITIATSKNKVPQKPPVEINFYADLNIDKNIIIIEDAKNIFVGALKSKNVAKEELTKTIKYTPYLVGIGALIPVVLLFVFWHHISESKDFEKYVQASFKWKSVPGEIINSHIETIKIKRNKKYVDGFRANVKYAYSVDKRPFISEMVSLDYVATTDINDAKIILRQFPKNQAVNVFYDPHNYNVSYLLPANLAGIKSHNKVLFYTMVALIFVLIIVAVVLVFVLKRTNEKQLKLLNSLESSYK